MENVNIVITKSTRMVYISKNTLGNDGESLQEKLILSFSDQFVDGTARLEITMPDDTSTYTMLTKVNETYELPVTAVMMKEGKIGLQLVITEGTNEEDIPIFKSNVFYLRVRKSINAQIEEEQSYSEWIDVASEKLNELDDAIDEASNLNITASKSGTTTTITLTDKEGETSTVSILDGVPGNDGSDGMSPIATVTQISGGATISITDSTGTTTATINNGVDGQAGQNGITPTIGNNGNWYLGETDTGKPSRGIQGDTGATGSAGQDGISPTVTTSKSGNTTTITITDRTGEHTATIIDGVDGTNGTDGRDGYVQYTAGDNITIENNVISAVASGSDVAGVYSITSNSSSAPFVLDGKKQGVYFFTTDYNTNKFYYKTKDSASVTTKNSTQMLYIELFKDVNYDNLESNETFGRAFYISGGYAMKSYVKKTAIPVTGGASVCDLLTNGTQTISGTKTFNSIPQLALYTAPSNDTQLVAKKYVDDTIGNINTILATLTTPSNNG